MKIYGDKNETESARRVMAMKAEQQSTNQQVVIPVFSGEAKLPCLWLGRAYDQFSKKAPQARPSKK